MSAHTCRTFDPTCWRCDLSQSEMEIPEHKCDTGFQDRVLCPAPCNTGHVYCSVCQEIQDACLLD